MSVFRGTVWTGTEWLEDAAVVTDGTVVRRVRPAEPLDPPRLDGLICPGLVNAHTHLELAHRERVVGGTGLPDWVGRVMSGPGVRDPEREQAGRDAALWLRRRGTAAVCDVSNRGDTASWIADAGLVGVVQHELLGFDRVKLGERTLRAGAPDEVLQGRAGPVFTRPAPHAPYSTPPELLVAASRPGSVPASIHLAEDRAELRFLTHGDGPFAEVLDHLGRDWRWWTPPDLDPAAYLDSLDLLGMDLMLVHGTWLGEAALRRVAHRGAPVCLCPRSNLHITGRLPDLPGMVEAGVSLALGTDSLASAPDLDVLGEIGALVAAFPELDPVIWLRAATAGGAMALRLPAGRLIPDATPGLLLLGARSASDLSEQTERRWLVPPG